MVIFVVSSKVRILYQLNNYFLIFFRLFRACVFTPLLITFGILKGSYLISIGNGKIR